MTKTPSVFNLKLPFLTQRERAEFKALRSGASLTFFNTKKCKREECSQEVPKVEGKLYCSRACWLAEEGESDVHEDNEG